MYRITITPSVDPAVAQRLLSTSFAGTPLAYCTNIEDGVGIKVSADQKTAEFDTDLLPGPDERVTDGESVISRYDLDDATVLVYDNPYISELVIAGPTDTAHDFLITFDTGDFDLPQHLASWGYTDLNDLCLTLAASGDTDVRIWVDEHYYAGTITSRCPARYVTDERNWNDVLIFDDYAAAQAWIDERWSGPYLLKNGEAGRPEYYIVK